MIGEVSDALLAQARLSSTPAVYFGDLPALDLECAALKIVDGYPSSRYFGATDLGEPLLEVVIRSKSYSNGQQWYSEIKTLLDRFSNEQVGIISCMLTGSPGYLGKDINEFCEWHMIFHVTLSNE